VTTVRYPQGKTLNSRGIQSKTRVRDCRSRGRLFASGKNSKNKTSKFTFEHIKLRAKLLDYFLRSNKSNINQSTSRVLVDRQCQHSRLVFKYIEVTTAGYARGKTLETRETYPPTSTTSTDIWFSNTYKLPRLSFSLSPFFFPFLV